MFYYIIPALDELGCFLYKSDKKLNTGNVVLISVRNKIVFGVVYKLYEEDRPSFKVKDIISITSLFVDVNMILYFSKEYYVKLGSICKMILPIKAFLHYNDFFSLKERRSFKIEENYSYHYDDNRLSQEQLNAKNIILEQNKPSLLFGVTGSGKTEVFLSIINSIQGQVLILVPEISLVDSIYQRLMDQYNIHLNYWHSKLTTVKRDKIFSQIISNKVKVIIGTRSAIFLPFAKLDLIIVDESHDSSFKQLSKVLYNAKDIALYLHQMRNTRLILSSATPSLNDYFFYKKGLFALAPLQNRHFTSLPEFVVEKIWNDILSKKLIDEIHLCVKNKKQILLFCSHRGYSKYLLCKSCFFSPECENCSVYLSVFGNMLKCKHCAFVKKMPNSCLKCEEKDLSFVGYGIERAFEYVQSYFKDYKVDYVTSDRSDALQIIDRFTKGEIDILLGTNIIAKGYNFPNLYLVAILNVDLGFLSGDLRSLESNFQLLSQVGGRAGRFEKGKILIQTFGTKDKFIQYLIKNDYIGFAENEIKSRGKFGPSSYIMQLIFMSRDELMVKKEALRIARGIKSSIGPVKAQIYKYNNYYRYVILIVSQDKKYLNIDKMKIHSSVLLKVDVNPYNYL